MAKFKIYVCPKGPQDLIRQLGAWEWVVLEVSIWESLHWLSLGPAGKLTYLDMFRSELPCY